MDDIIKALIKQDTRQSMSVYLREIALLMEEVEMLKMRIKEMENGKIIKDIEECFNLLKEVRQVFSNLSGDSVVERSAMHRICVRIDKLIKEI